VLAVLTGALDLATETARHLVLATLASLDDDRLATYTVLVRRAASQAARQALEALMTTTQYRDAFIDRFRAEGMAEGRAAGQAEGRAEGEARMVLRVLSARGLEVSSEIRQQVLSCTDTAQLEAWGERAATADTLDDVFSG
jgi:predicted transposase YdaD